MSILSKGCSTTLKVFLQNQTPLNRDWYWVIWSTEKITISFWFHSNQKLCQIWFILIHNLLRIIFKNECEKKETKLLIFCHESKIKVAFNFWILSIFCTSNLANITKFLKIRLLSLVHIFLNIFLNLASAEVLSDFSRVSQNKICPGNFWMICSETYDYYVRFWMVIYDEECTEINRHRLYNWLSSHLLLKLVYKQDELFNFNSSCWGKDRMFNAVCNQWPFCMCVMSRAQNTWPLRAISPDFSQDSSRK